MKEEQFYYISDEYGLRYTVDRGMKQVNKTKWFKTDAARENFINKQIEKDESFTVESYSDPITK